METSQCFAGKGQDVGEEFGEIGGKGAVMSLEFDFSAGKARDALAALLHTSEYLSDAFNGRVSAKPAGIDHAGREVLESGGQVWKVG